MAWVFLILAGICEIIGVLFMKVATEKKGWAPKVILIANFGVSFFFLSLAMNTLPMGTAYAIWTGIGTAGSALLGILIFRESADWRRLAFLSCILWRCWLKTIKLTRGECHVERTRKENISMDHTWYRHSITNKFSYNRIIVS